MTDIQLGSDKYRFIDNLMKLLMLPDNKLLTQRIDTLVHSNNQLYGVNHNGFSWRNYYLERGGRVVEMLIWEPSCHPSLEDKASKIVLHWKNVTNDYEYLTLVLRDLLAPCTSKQDARDALPECLIQFIPSLNQLPRTREVGYTLDSQASVTLQNVLGTFHTYAAMHLMI